MNKFIYKYEAMTTPCELIIYATAKAQADASAMAVLNETKRLEKKYNYFKSDSFLSSINSRQTDIIDNETKSILQRAKQYYKATNGIFDITIATIKELYKNEKNLSTLEAKKSELLQYVGCEHFSLKKDKIIFDNEHTKIDLGGFVKEYAVDRAVVVLKKHKINAALINYGGDIYALGKKPDGSKFKIGIKDPKNKTQYAQEVELENQALTTSASYERNYTIEGKTFSHIISKEENNSSVNSVTVISNNCVESGVYSTAIMIDSSLTTTNRLILL